jgi:hypothetical protein
VRLPGLRRPSYFASVVPKKIAPHVTDGEEIMNAIIYFNKTHGVKCPQIQNRQQNQAQDAP